MKQAFLEFLTDEDLLIRLLPDAAVLYFCKGGPVVTTRILRMFLEYMAQSRTGLIVKANRVLKHDTVHNYVLMLSTVLKRCQNPLERGVIVASYTWIDGYLIPKGMVTILGKEKHICYDISTLVRTILSPEYMATIPYTRVPLQLVLFLSLATDCSGRVGEFLATYGKKKKPTFLCWRYTTIVAFRIPAEVILRGTIRFENLKDGSGDPNKRKIILLRLLLLELVAEDSFRLLLVLGLIDQVFEGLRC
ncbi:hypothetical protein B7494_g3297 [Chlorociboria aeruginascens]|nr:hypothetical protein B7494_g3297 [Chlorociboria aeruginascens]